MTTPEHYFEQHPNVAVLVYSPSVDMTVQLKNEEEIGFTYQCIRIDWTGYDRNRVIFESPWLSLRRR